MFRHGGMVLGVIFAGYAVMLAVSVGTGADVPMTTWVVPDKPPRAEAEPRIVPKSAPPVPRRSQAPDESGAVPTTSTPVSPSVKPSVKPTVKPTATSTAQPVETEPVLEPLPTEEPVRGNKPTEKPGNGNGNGKP